MTSDESDEELPGQRSSTRRTIRDSPDNPFLASPENPVSDADSSANPSSQQERPTIAYVLYVSSPFSEIYINDPFQSWCSTRMQESII